jgi:capsular polysaccharide biosynthesis protein
MKKQNEEINIKDLINLFIPKLWIILVCAVVLSIILGGYAFLFKSDTFTSSATIMVSKSNSTSISSSDIDLSAKVIDSVEIVIFSRNFLTEIANAINNDPKYAEYNWNVSTGMLSGALRISPNENTSTFLLSATTTDKLLSYAITDTVSNHIMGDSSILDEYLPQSYGVIDMTMLDDPLPGAKNSKGVVTNALIGFLVGAVVSIVVIYIVAMFDVVIHDRKKLEDNFDYPILGVIPRYEVEISEEELQEVEN